MPNPNDQTILLNPFHLNIYPNHIGEYDNKNQPTIEADDDTGMEYYSIKNKINDDRGEDRLI